jgi:hypothetical protein
LLTEQQRSALNRSCPQCRCGTMHVVARLLDPEITTYTIAVPTFQINSS